MPLGSTGGCQTTLTSVRRTSGNTSLMGGPGTVERGNEGAKMRLLYHHMTLTVIKKPINIIRNQNLSLEF